MSDIRRSEVQAETQYANYREKLRSDFLYQCAYCTLAESEAMGLTYEIEHYLPREHFPELENEYFNLLYACDVCNSYKSDHFATESELAACRRFYRPDWDERRHNFRLAGVDLAALSPVGDHTIEMLFLNREALRELRKLRFKLYEAAGLVEEGLMALHGQSLDSIKREERLRFKALRERLAARDEELAALCEDLMRAARSYLLDPDPAHRVELRARRWYLAQIRGA